MSNTMFTSKRDIRDQAGKAVIDHHEKQGDREADQTPR